MADEVLTSYSGVTLSQDDINSLDDSNSQPVEQEGEQTTQELGSQETDQSNVPETEHSEDFTEISELELDGETHDMETISKALEAYKNKSDWQKSNTEKSQALSADRKAIDAERATWAGIRNNEDAMEALRDVLDDDHPIFAEPKVEMANEDTRQDTEEPNKLQELEDKLNELVQEKETQANELAADRQVTADLTHLKHEHPELEDQALMDNVIKTAIEKGFTGPQGLEDAFVLTYHTSAEDSAFKTAVNRARSAKAAKSIPETEGSVRGEHTEPITKSANYREARQDALKNYTFYE